MPRASSIYAPENWSQRKQRRELKVTDKHGRKWYMTIETKTGDPTGLIQPLFQAPYIPDQKYLKVNEDNPNHLDIDYELAKADIRRARAEWEREGRQLSQKMHGSKYNPLDDFTSEVLDVIGPPPQAIEPVIAAQQGNPWVLGKTNRVDLRLVRFFEPEQLDPELRKEREPDFSKLVDTEEGLEEIPRVGRGGGRMVDEDRQRQRQQIVTNRPNARAEGKGNGGGKNLPRGGEQKQARKHYPKGHAKEGQFIPKEELAELEPATTGG